MTRIAIAGGGLAGSLVALALANRRPDVDFVLVEQGDVFGGNHTWSSSTAMSPTNNAGS